MYSLVCKVIYFIPSRTNVRLRLYHNPRGAFCYFLDLERRKMFAFLPKLDNGFWWLRCGPQHVSTNWHCLGSPRNGGCLLKWVLISFEIAIECPWPDCMVVSTALLVAGQKSVITTMFGHPFAVALAMARRIAKSSASTEVTCPAGAFIDAVLEPSHPTCRYCDSLPLVGGREKRGSLSSEEHHTKCQLPS